MRHNQNNRRMRGGHRGGNGHHGGGHHHSGQGNRRINPRVQTFDSNGPDVRIRGNAYQVAEKYLALARDATAAGDRVLAESYFQHAEYYQRMINEYMASEAQNNPGQQQPHHGNGQAQPAVAAPDQQPVIPDGAMPDLDQSFLVGPRRGAATQPAAAEEPKDKPEAEAI